VRQKLDGEIHDGGIVDIEFVVEEVKVDFSCARKLGLGLGTRIEKDTV
jgi:hypothetical protein